MHAPTLPCVCLQHRASGDQLLVSLFGAQVLSWVSAGRERLFLSPRTIMDGRAPIRGGVPICFPQFNQRGPLPKHGFARTLMWQVAQAPHELADGSVQAVLSLTDSEWTRAMWPHAFEITLTLTLSAGGLLMQVDVHNRGKEPMNFACALHTYLAVAGIERSELHGLEAANQWDTVLDRHLPGSGQSLRFSQEFDSVFAASSGAMQLLSTSEEGASTGLQIEQSDTFTETVVWNPHAALCAKLADMDADSYERMLCVEAAKLLQTVNLPSQKRWAGWQRLTVQD